MENEEREIEVTKEMKEALKGLREFIEYWDADLKPHAHFTIQVGLPFYVQLCNGENLSEAQEAGIFDAAQMAGVTDLIAIHQVSDMMTEVDTCIINQSNPKRVMAFVLSVLANDDYYSEYDLESVECKNFKLLAKKLEHGLSLLKNMK
jgi:hypothetical protein